MAAFDSSPPSAPARTSPGPFIAMTVVTLASVAIAAGLVLTAGDSEAAADSAKTPARGTTLTSLVTPGLDDDAKMLRLDYAHRHAQLRRAGDGAYDPTLHAALDLVQAEQAATPCATFAAALKVLEDTTAADHDWALQIAAVPAPGASESSADCAPLAARLEALRSPEPTRDDAPQASAATSKDPLANPFEATDEPAEDPGPVAVAKPEPKPKPASKPPKKSGKSSKTAKKSPFADTDMKDPFDESGSDSKSDDHHIGTKLDEELKPMGGG